MYRSKGPIVPDKQQLALPFYPPYFWAHGYCGCCADDTYLDNKFPVGWCKGCVDRAREEDAEFTDEAYDDYMTHRQKTLDFMRRDFPNVYFPDLVKPGT
jgi:hypothetical protein